MRRYEVVVDHESAYSDPITLGSGDRVTFERRESEWAGWIWCTNASGVEGWVPESWMTLDDATAVARRDYTARELTVRRGDTLVGLDEESGWAWCVTDVDESGWVPLANLEAIAGWQYRAICPACGRRVGRLSTYGSAPCPTCGAIIQPVTRSVLLALAAVVVAVMLPMLISIAGLLHWYASLALQGVILIAASLAQPYLIPYRYVGAGRHCRRCGYDLRGATGQACPECGRTPDMV